MNLRPAVKKQKRIPMWLTGMYWRGPFVDPSGNPMSFGSVWAYRLKQFGRRILTVRKGERLIADIFFTLWVSMDVLALIEGTPPLLPLSVLGAIFGSLLVFCEWWIFVKEYRESAPLHVLWQPRFLQAPRQPYLYVHFESKSCLPLEVRCTFADAENRAMSPSSGFQEFVPNKNNRQFDYPTQILRSVLDGRQSFRLHVEIASLLAHPKLHDHWVYNYTLDEASGKFKRGSGYLGPGTNTTQTWWYPEDQDAEWLRWHESL